ncbi:hypothetical protein IGS59_15670 [Janthinobacterium sp. GW460P]|uniref:hypothetical protein n=1 Tax=unclassified Janthinobacterium TaxID=2610881 RepID=UPI000A32266A|nr:MULTISPECIES: hypothetical protein [unclassified Janthinobacterium]MCC7703687.1 hypothetical protein [Janthinobacterium sp. GW460P]MCC7709353.1 hypothetical protein [Janthinobacterium sp. GW460W]
MTDATQPQRIHNPPSIDAAALRAAIAADGKVIVQFGEHFAPEPLLADLDALAAACGAALEIRFYGYHFTPFDAAILRDLPHAANLSLDCHTSAVNLQTLGELPHLQRLQLGVYEMQEHDILALENLRTLEYLSLGETRKANIDLAPLRHWPQLAQLHTTGHVKNIDAITALPALTKLSLSQVKSKDDVDFINAMPALAQLRFILGGRASIAHVTAPLLEELEVVRVRGLEDLGDLGRFARLRRLSVEDQIKLAELRLGENPALASLILRNCKTLERLAGITTLPTLNNLAVYLTQLDIDALLAGGLPAALKHLTLATGKRKRDEEIKAQLAALGYAKARFY